MTGYSDRLLAVADHLEPGEGFFVAGMLIAKNSAGRLRVGFGDVCFNWPRGDAADLIARCVSDRLDTRVMGHLAWRYRQVIQEFLISPRAFPITGIARVDAHVERHARQGRRLDPCEVAA